MSGACPLDQFDRLAKLAHAYEFRDDKDDLVELFKSGGVDAQAPRLKMLVALALSSFYTVWLKADPEEHMGRVRKQGDLRPMADDRSAMTELRNILLSREPLYSRASAVVEDGCRDGVAPGRIRRQDDHGLGP